MADKFGKKYDRLFAAIVTPFKEDGEVDEPALRRLLQYFMQPKFVDAGGAIVINPEAGELFYLDRREKRRNVEIAVEECGGKVSVFAGATELATRDAVKISVDAKEAGAEGLFIFPPMGAVDISIGWDAERYPEVWIDMARAQIEATDLPAIAHPMVRAKSIDFGRGMPPAATLQMCRELPNVVGWKMLYGGGGGPAVSRALRTLDHHVSILWPGVSPGNLYTGYFDGTLSGSWNYSMELTVEHIQAWRRGDIKEAQRIWKSGLEELQGFVLSTGHSHVTFKCATWLRGLIPLPFCRPPMPLPRRDEVLKLAKGLAAAGLSIIPEKDISRVVAQLPR